MIPEYDIRKRTFQFALSVVRTCRKIQEKEREFILTKQLLRSGTSVGANIREAKNAESKKDFIRKSAISLKEADESQYWIELLLELHPNWKEELQELKNEVEQLVKIISKIIINSKRNSMVQ